MTTSVMIASPYNSLSGLSVQVETRNDDGTWSPKGAPITVNPRETAETLHITSSERVVILTAPPVKVQPL